LWATRRICERTLKLFATWRATNKNQSKPNKHEALLNKSERPLTWNVLLKLKRLVHQTTDHIHPPTVFQGIREVFEKATQAALQVKKKKKKACIIL
jgi:hypothetical protein